MAEQVVLDVPETFRRGGKQGNQRRSIDSGRWLLHYMCRVLGHDSLAQKSVLDMGCGVKFTQAILEYDIPIGRYVGVDVYPGMIEFLQREVSDPRFEFIHMDSHNAMYNPKGRPLSEYTALPLGPERFDIICLFSVFTHLAPHDYRRMLELLRPWVEDRGQLIFSLFINERTRGGHGLVDDLTRNMPAPPEGTSVPDFEDLDPDQPLKFALYSRDHARRLIEGTGWRIEHLLEPQADKQIQHHFICSPA